MTKRNPSAFSDVAPIWQAALTTPGLTLRFESPNRAIYYHQRIYRYRATLIKHQEELSPIPGFYGSTPYDHLTIRREGNVLIFYEKSLTGIAATDAEGNPVELFNNSFPL